MGRGANDQGEQPRTRKLSEAQESTLLSLGYCQTQQVNSTREISAHDQYAQQRLRQKRGGGTTQRLKALQARGLAEKVDKFSDGQSTWKLTTKGEVLYKKLAEARRHHPQATKSIYGIPDRNHWLTSSLGKAD